MDGILAVTVSTPSQSGWGSIAGLFLALFFIMVLISAIRGR